MSRKFGIVSDETKELVNKVLTEVGLNTVADFQVLNPLNSNELIKVGRLNPIGEEIAKRNTVIYISIYERAFNVLSEEQQELLVRDAINLISYDSEKDRINLNCPKLVVTCGGRMKWGNKLIDAAETAVLAIQQIKDEEKEQKEAERALKSAKKSKNRN